MIVRPIALQDLSIRVEWMNHPMIYSSMHYNVPILLENTISWYNANLLNHNRYDAVFEEKGEIVAMGGLTNIDRIVNKAELYIFVNPNSHSKGIGTQASALLCKYGFVELKLSKICLVTNESNISAQKMYEKIGFKLEGRLRKEVFVNGKIEDRFYYGLFFDDLLQL